MTARPPGNELWCCGSLHTASISVGTADFVTILLVTAHYIESTLFVAPFSIEMVAIVLVAVFLFFSSILMVYGVVKKFSWLLLPWMILRLAAIVGSIIFCSIKFQDIGGQRTIPILGTAIQVYFFMLIFAAYVDLRKLNQMQSGAATSEEAGLQEDQHKNKCLIDLELMEEKHDPDVSGNIDDTFTQLAFRDTAGFGGDEKWKALPTPDEVIILPENDRVDGGSTKEEALASIHNDSVHSNDSQPVKSSVIPRRPATNSKSVANLGESNGSIGALQPLLPPAKSEPKILASGSLTHVDNNFSPFRSKSAAQNGPKMKIFLPNHDDEDSDDDNGSSDDDVIHTESKMLPKQI